MTDFSHGLVPAVVQDAASGQVLMLAYMNEEAYLRTLETKEVYFYSRSRQVLWKKGETSGHILELKELWWDCDNDSILIKAMPHGPSCHTGLASCFHKRSYGEAQPQPMDIINSLKERMQGARQATSPRSYSEELMLGPLGQGAKKIVEEAGELVIAVVSQEKNQVVYEAADLLFHTLAVLTRLDIDITEVLAALAKRWK